MRILTAAGAGLAGAALLAGCGDHSGRAEVDRAIESLNAIDENGLNDVMLNAADPAEAVAYFRKASAEAPERIDLKRGLAKSLIRAKQPRPAAAAWAEVAESGEATRADRVAYADALIRDGAWDEAEAVLDRIPPTFETYRRYRLEAMVADSNREWDRADEFYETAAGLTTQPSAVLNNWGYSKLTRGDPADAEKLFVEALSYDPDSFTAMNNLVLARAKQRRYALPILDVTEEERAKLLHTMALAAIKQGDVATGKGLLEDAIAAHPRYFAAAARSLEALEGTAAGG